MVCGTLLGMKNTIITSDAINPASLIGKPLVVYVDGTKHTIGYITKAEKLPDKLFVAAALLERNEDGPDHS